MRRSLEAIRNSIRLLSRGIAQKSGRRAVRRVRREQTESLEVRQLLTGTFEWANTLGQLADGVAIDASGHVYTLGSFSGTVDFDSGPGVFELTSAGSSDLYVTKVDNSGTFEWARRIGGTGASEAATGIALDSSGNVYTTGGFTGTVDFDPGSGVADLSAESSNDVFVSKLDSNGNYVWARRLGGSSHDFSADIAVDSAGSVVTTGYFIGTSDFNPGAGVNNLTSAGNNADLFVSKLDSNGDYVWAHRIGGTSFDEALGVAVDSAGNVFTTGLYQGTVDFNPGAEVNNLPGEAFSESTFILKLDSNGDYVWARRTGGTGSGFSTPQDIAMDSTGNVLTTGYFSGTIDFNPGAGVNNLTTAGKRDIFVSKLDNGGNYVWARKMGGSLDDEAEGITVDLAGNVFTTGHFRSISDFDPGASVFNLTSAGKTDTFVSKLDSNGNFTWARRIGGTEADQGNAISVDTSGNIPIVGSFVGTVDFDPGA
jgi:hypothetical protein